MNIAIIPARGGSKRIPQKNSKLFADKPMLSYAISSAKESGLFDNIIVSSEDDYILKLAAEQGALALKRPLDLADDYTPILPVISQAIAFYEKEQQEIENVCCIFPTVPFLTAQILQNSFSLFKEKEAPYVFPVIAFTSPIERALHLEKDGKIKLRQAEFQQTRTQDLPPAYHDAGQFYWGKKSAWIEGKAIHSNGYGFILPSWCAVDIDTLDDWKRAELIYQLLKVKETV